MPRDDRPCLSGLDDAQIRQMAERNHQPEETWLSGYAGTAQARVLCGMCEQEWPCATVKELRRTEVESTKKSLERGDGIAPRPPVELHGGACDCVGCRYMSH